MAGLVQVAFNNANYVILAARLTPPRRPLLARLQLGVSYQEKISGVMLRIAYPVYSRTRRSGGPAPLHERASRLHATLLVPMLALIAATAPGAHAVDVRRPRGSAPSARCRSSRSPG